MSLDCNSLVLTDGVLASPDFQQLDPNVIAFIGSIKREIKVDVDIVMATVMRDEFVESKDTYDSIRFKTREIYTETGFDPKDWKRLRYEEDQRLKGVSNLMAIGRQPLFVGTVPTLLVNGDFDNDVALAATKSILESQGDAEYRFEYLYYKKCIEKDGFISYVLPNSLGGEQITMFNVRTTEIDGIEFGLSKVCIVSRGNSAQVLKHVKFIFEFPSQ